VKATCLEGFGQLRPVGTFPGLDLGELGDQLPTPAVQVLADCLSLGL
jgi:hypothetical protein